MTSLLGRCRLILIPFSRIQPLRGTQRNYSVSSVNSNSETDYEIDETLLLTEENRQRCLEKMCRSPPVGLKLRGAKNETKFASVLIALCTDEITQNVSVLYTRRSHLLSRHMRQISFPGGIKEDNEDFVQCALRETEEEIGLSPQRVEIWGTDCVDNLERK
ncbi:mitochondrial coenzyme A diphosphatase NUDT8 isoform 3-T4 [Cochliomyia hominivorax]